MANQDYISTPLTPDQFIDGLTWIDLDPGELSVLAGLDVARVVEWMSGDESPPPWVGALLGALTVPPVRRWAADLLAQGEFMPDPTTPWFSKALRDAGVGAREFARITGLRADRIETWGAGRALERVQRPWIFVLLGAMTVPEARRIVLEYTEQSTTPVERPPTPREVRRAAQRGV
jgi:hypothetical protein